jgi:hypothetical protein
MPLRRGHEGAYVHDHGGVGDWGIRVGGPATFAAWRGAPLTDWEGASLAGRRGAPLTDWEGAPLAAWRGAPSAAWRGASFSAGRGAPFATSRGAPLAGWEGGGYAEAGCAPSVAVPRPVGDSGPVPEPISGIAHVLRDGGPAPSCVLTVIDGVPAFCAL